MTKTFLFATGEYNEPNIIGVIREDRLEKTLTALEGNGQNLTAEEVTRRADKGQESILDAASSHPGALGPLVQHLHAHGETIELKNWGRPIRNGFSSPLSNAIGTGQYPAAQEALKKVGIRVAKTDFFDQKLLKRSHAHRVSVDSTLMTDSKPGAGKNRSTADGQPVTLGLKLPKAFGREHCTAGFV